MDCSRTANIRQTLGLGKLATANSITFSDISGGINEDNISGLGTLATVNAIATYNLKLLSQTTTQALIWDGQQWTVQGTKNIRQTLGLGKLATANSITFNDISGE